MRKYCYFFFLFLIIQIGYSQDILFDSEIEIPSGFAPEELVMPPSPLTTQIIFIGGYDLVQTTETYGNPAGQAIAKEWHDFIGFTPDPSDESLGWITVNHEMIYEDDRIGDGGGMTVFKVNKDADGSIQVMDQKLEDGREGQFFNVDFVNTVGETGMNCAGISAPDGRIWTAEEWYRTSTSSIFEGNFRPPSNSWLPQNPAPTDKGYGVRDTSIFTIDAPEFPLVDGLSIPKYENFNYMVEVDPMQARAIRKQYNWGRAGWEGGAITQDMKTVYLGIDLSPAPFAKFEAVTPGDFTDGTLYVYKHDNEQENRWIEVPKNQENIFGGLVDFAWSAGATMFMRNEWVTIDYQSGIVYWTETGRDSESSGPGILFNRLTTETNAVIPPHHEALAEERGFESAGDEGYQDYYGRVLYYNPSTEEYGVMIEGGPYFESSPEEESYPSKHLSNPDGLNMITIDNNNFLMICEDLNGTSHGRVPAGVSNRLCELYLLNTSKMGDATVEDLVRITAVPSGAEITGAIQIDENTVLVNSQHPNSDNPFPFNHSLTAAIHGFAETTVSALEHPNPDGKNFRIYPNPVTRELYLSEAIDFAIYNIYGSRIKVFRNTDQADVGDLLPGTYFLNTEANVTYKFIVQ